MEPRTQQQYDEMLRLRNEQGIKVWLGGNDIDVEGEWVWDSDGSSVDLSRFWRGGEPNDAAQREDCMQMFYDTGFGDFPCFFSQPFACSI